jgi:integrase
VSAVRIINRGGWFYAVIQRPRGAGRAIRQALGTQNEAEARQKVKDGKLEELAKVDAADAFTREVWTRMIAGKNVRVGASIDGFREHRTVMGKPMTSIRCEQRALAAFVRHVSETDRPDFANANIAAVTTKQVSSWVNAEGDAKLSTRGWKLNAVKVWLQWNVDQRWLVVNPASNVIVRLDALTQEQLIAKPHAPFTDEQAKTLLASVPRTSWWHGAILFGYTYGLTVGAIATMEFGNVAGQQLKIYRTKGRRVVNERLTDEIIAWLEEWKVIRPPSDTEYLFTAQAAAYLNDPADLSHQFRHLCDKAGVTGVSFHGLRKTAARRIWASALSSLGDESAQALAALVAKNGYRKVQKLLAHAPGSEVTAAHYLPQPT